MSGIWEKIKERLGFGRKAEGDKEDDKVMYIIAGLGNPTREYEKTIPLLHKERVQGV